MAMAGGSGTKTFRPVFLRGKHVPQWIKADLTCSSIGTTP
jgi:hypothetical protein